MTLSKALGSQGGAVLGSTGAGRPPRQHRAPFIYDTGLAPAAAGAALRPVARTPRGHPACPHRVLAHARRLADAVGVDAPVGRCAVGVDVRTRAGAATRSNGCWPAAYGSAASVHRRCPTGSADCGSPPVRTSPTRTSSAPSQLPRGASASAREVRRRHRDRHRCRQDGRHGRAGVRGPDQRPVRERRQAVPDRHHERRAERRRHRAPTSPGATTCTSWCGWTTRSRRSPRHGCGDSRCGRCPTCSTTSSSARTGRDVTVVEGAGGVAVRLDLDGGTITTLAARSARPWPAGRRRRRHVGGARHAQPHRAHRRRVAQAGPGAGWSRPRCRPDHPRAGRVVQPRGPAPSHRRTRGWRGSRRGRRPDPPRSSGGQRPPGSLVDGSQR